MTNTHCVSRISSYPVQDLRLFFHHLGRTLTWPPGTPESPSAPQDVPAVVAEACQHDPGLAPHFLVVDLSAPASPDGGEAGTDRRSRRRPHAAQPVEDQE